MKSSCFFIAGSLLFAGCAGSLPPPGVWEYTGGPFAQNVSTLLVDRQFPTALYAGLTNGQIFSCEGSWYQGEAPVLRDGSWHKCKITNGQVFSCDGSWFQGTAVVYTDR